MAFPVPKDVRAGRDFEIIKGIPELIRMDVKINDLADSFDPGEPVKLSVASGELVADKLDTGDDGTTEVYTKICWTRYRQDDSWGGQSDVQATKALTVISGSFQAKTTLFTASGTYDPGSVLVSRWDTVALEPRLFGIAANAADAENLAMAVGRSLGVDADGKLWFESID